jgi:predicted GNAT family acetyltransferase
MLFILAGTIGKKEMNMQNNKPDVIHNIERNSFEVTLDSFTAELIYQQIGDIIVFTHTGVPAVMEGRGIGSMLVKTGLEYARDNNLKVQALCSFVDGYIQRHVEYRDLLK